MVDKTDVIEVVLVSVVYSVKVVEKTSVMAEFVIVFVLCEDYQNSDSVRTKPKGGHTVFSTTEVVVTGAAVTVTTGV